MLREDRTYGQKIFGCNIIYNYIRDHLDDTTNQELIPGTYRLFFDLN